MSRQDEIKQLITTYNRRLQIRQEQKALEGPSVSPKILIEIEDIEAELAALRAELAELETASEPPPEPPPLADAPYRGLEVFDVDYAHLFFGREALTAKLLDRIDQARFLAVVGPSGSGKSSAVRAGLLHQVRQGALPGSGGWRTLLVTPTAHPLEALAHGLRSLLPDLGPRAILNDLEIDQRGLHMLLQDAITGDIPLLLVVDQFEELFSLCRAEPERRLYLENLLYAVEQAEGPVKLILTMRADFYGRCAAYPALAAQVERSQVIVGPMTDAEISQAIVQPAGLAGLAVEPELVTEILADVHVRLWNARTGAEMFALRGHQQGVRCVAFNPAGTQLATGGEDGTVRLWNAQSGELEAILPDAVGTELVVNWNIDQEDGVLEVSDPSEIPTFVLDVDYSPSGDRVVAASLDGSVDIYVASIERLLEIAQAQVTRELTCRERVQFLYEDLDCPVEETTTPEP